MSTVSTRADFKGWIYIKDRNEYRLSTAEFTEFTKTLGMSVGNKYITPSCETASSAFYKGLLQGFFDIAGSVCGTRLKGYTIRLSQSNLTNLYAVQRMLLRLGIICTIYKDRRKAGKNFYQILNRNLKEYSVKANYELVISKVNLLKFYELINFTDSIKKINLRLL